MDPEALQSLTDEEIVDLLIGKKIPAYNLEKLLGDDSRAVSIRRSWFKRECGLGEKLNNLPYSNLDYSLVTDACCENVIGHISVPVGYAGPLLVDGVRYHVPMATTEGCLVASTNRGCRAVSVDEGVTTAIFNDSMTRGPVVEFDNAKEAARFKHWTEIPNNFQIMKQTFNGTSRFAKLKEINCMIIGRLVFMRFCATTGDAMGMNMVSKGTEEVLKLLSEKYHPSMKIISLSGNYCVDKKPAAINWIEGRGKSVVAEAIVSAKVVHEVLKTDVPSMVKLNISKNLVGSAISGAIGGFNAHSSNVVTAIFLATGQDVAQNVTSSNCLTFMEATDEGDLRISCTMPCLEVGTVGGGTILPAQRTCLELLGCAGSNIKEPGANAKRLASIIAATVLAGELSLLAALSKGHLVQSHMKHNRSAVNLKSLDADEERYRASSSADVRKSATVAAQLSALAEKSLQGIGLQPESCSKVLT